MISERVHKAVILAAGRGTRMRELTLDLPKPMIPVRGKPILEHIIGGLREAGFDEILLIVGYRADVVQAHFGDGAAFGLTIRYCTQSVQDGTGKVVELARGFCGRDPFLLSYGDILVDAANYQTLANLDNEQAIVTVKHSDDVSKGGAIFIGNNWRVTDVREKPQPGEPTSPWYNAGVYVFRPTIFDYTARLEKSSRGEYELTDAIRALAQNATVRALELAGDWADVRDPEILAELNS